MTDFNMVNVEGQIGKTIDYSKINSLHYDQRDLTQLIPILKNLQQVTARILKEYHQYLQKRERKMGMPYGMLRKFQTIKITLSEVQQLLEFQCRFYANEVGNREYDKSSEQAFFRQTLKSYDERRLWMKAYILRMESRVQVIEEQVMKNVDYETHRFTQFLSELNVERLQHNYQQKLDVTIRTCKELQKNVSLREKIKIKLQQIRAKQKQQSNEENKQVEQVIGLNQQHKEYKIQLKTAEQNKQTISPNKNKQKQNFFCRFKGELYTFFALLYFYLNKTNLRNQFFYFQLKDIRNKKGSLCHSNQQLKLAIDRIQQHLQFMNNEQAIVSQICRINNNFQIQKELIRPSKIEGVLTKTDFFIYLKELHRHSKQIINKYGLGFEYSIRSKKAFSNKGKSRSSQKIYTCKQPSNQIKLHEEKKQKEQLKKYIAANRQRIMEERKNRQANKLPQKQNKNNNIIENQDSKSIQNQNMSNLLSEIQEQENDGIVQQSNYAQVQQPKQIIEQANIQQIKQIAQQLKNNLNIKQQKENVMLSNNYSQLQEGEFQDI